MSYAARMEFGLFEGEEDESDAFLSLRTVIHCCYCLYCCDVEYLLSKYGDSAPDLYDAGVYYQTPKSECGGDVWQDIRTLLERKYGDCKDLACYLAAQRTVRQGIHCVPYVKRKWFENGFALYHVVVKHPDGCRCGDCDDKNIEDPSALLGMPLGDGA